MEFKEGDRVRINPESVYYMREFPIGKIILHDTDGTCLVELPNGNTLWYDENDLTLELPDWQELVSD